MRDLIWVFAALLLLVGCTAETETQSNTTVQADTTKPVLSSGDADDFARQSSSIGQQVYVPVYSHIDQQDRQKTFNLTTTLSIRNADP